MTVTNTSGDTSGDVSRPLSPSELDALSITLRSALVSDILDGMGLREQCLAPGLVAERTDHTLVGYAYNTRAVVIDEMPADPYTGLLEALDGIGAGDVYLISSSSDAALWGELTSTAVRSQGARGAVCDGYLRDVRMVRELGFPAFSRGTSPRDCAGRVEISREPGSLAIGGVTVANGDLVVGDEDGVVVIPAHLIEDVVTAALEKSAAESEFRTAVRQGMKPSEAFERFGVL
ncbi:MULTISPECIES: RraA family protein [unclassified Nocardioides]|uniref:RraA family protein n=1 Tax=unclassified Nocardioides TaxID=2615069 RepID=UPI0006FB2293|nr:MULTISPECIES: RraA family protein [unclassified Nocardioides]KRA37677.1 hypothetical protein ASD81_02960 [Nocardioides sp. Root614]KRA91637.1 hypothetical protein ASD84_03225 [Nocardioides sp. Root682]